MSLIEPGKHERLVVDFEQMACEVEATGDFLVLRRLQPYVSVFSPLGIKLRTSLFVDVETTGLDLARSEIIELAAPSGAQASDVRLRPDAVEKGD